MEKSPYPDKPGQPFVIPKEEMPQVRSLTPKELRELGLLIGKPGRKKAERTREGLSEQEAQEVLGEDLIGSEAIENVWGVPPEVPPIPFSREDLETAKKLGQFLILRIDKAKDGVPLTMLKIHEQLRDEYQRKGYGKVLFSATDEWKLSSAFYTTETPRAQWALVGKEVILGSTGKNYIEQTDEIEQYLKTKVFDGQMLPREYEEAIEEWHQEKASITELISTNWQDAAERLEKLKIIQLTRATPVETLFDIDTYLLSRGKRLLETNYAWTGRRSSDGYLVDVGRANTDGAMGGGWEPERSHAGLGVVFSRLR